MAMTSLEKKDILERMRCPICLKDFSSTSNRNKHALKFHNTLTPTKVGRPFLGGKKQANHRYYKKITTDKIRPQCKVLLIAAREEFVSLDKDNLIALYMSALERWDSQLQKSRQIMSLKSLNNWQSDSSYWEFLTFALITHYVRKSEIWFEPELFFNSTSPLSGIYSSKSYPREHLVICEKFWTTPMSRFNCLLKVYCKAVIGYLYV